MGWTCKGSACGSLCHLRVCVCVCSVLSNRSLTNRLGTRKHRCVPRWSSILRHLAKLLIKSFSFKLCAEKIQAGVLPVSFFPSDPTVKPDTVQDVTVDRTVWEALFLLLLQLCSYFSLWSPRWHMLWSIYCAEDLQYLENGEDITDPRLSW